jgi:tetratricopeptide (TPR) repeat protein
LLSGLGRVREAIIHYQWLRQIQPRDARVVVGLCRCLADQQEWDEARRLLDELLASQPDNVPALVERGRLELRRGKADAALPLLRQATRQAAHDREAFWVLHLCLEMLDQQEEDRRCLDEVARIDGDRQRLSHLLSRIQEDGQDLSSRYEAGTLLLRTGREAEGVRMLSAILEQDPRHRPARTALAEYYQRQPN